MREFRCFPEAEPNPAGRVNSWAGSPRNEALGAFWALRAVVDGPVNELTGYVCNIVELDAVIRDTALPQLAGWMRRDRHALVELGAELVSAFPLVAKQFSQGPSFCSLELFLSPFLRLAVEREEPTLVLITQSFEFSASHRLHCPKFTEEENQKTFGKCANLNGHGHNYVVDVTVVGRPGEEPPQGLDVEQVQRTVKKQVIDRFDHKHLNLDCAEFRSLNPSVENIARVIWSLLVGALAPDRLASIRVWETPKTYAEFDGVE